MSQVSLRTTIAGCVVALLLTSVACNRVSDSEADIELSPRDALIARATALELDTPYVPPPGDALTHHTSGFAKVLCSAVFITGLDAGFAAESIGYFQSPYDERAKVTERVVDLEKKEVRLTLPNGVTRVARYLGDQGCVTLPIGEDEVYFTPAVIETTLPDASTEPWPMGDLLPDEPLPADLDMERSLKPSTRHLNHPKV